MNSDRESPALRSVGLNDFSSSTNYGIQTHTVHGDVYYHQTHHLHPATQQQEQFENKTLEDIILRADAAIRKYYESTERLKTERLSGETLPLEKCYINLALINLSSSIQLKDQSSFNINARLRLEAGAKGENIALKHLFTSSKLSNSAGVTPRRIFIRGRAGIGKTTLCKKIVYEFLQGRLGNKLFDRLLWLPLRGLRKKTKNTEYGWLEVLQASFSPSPQVPKWNELMAVMSDRLSDPDFRLKTLFLLDGLDEVSREWDEEVFKFLETLICDVPNIIITSRPQANSLKIGKFDIELETIGFTPDQITIYINHSVKNERTRSSMKSLIMSKPLLQGLLRIPVQLDAFCCTWSSETSRGDPQLTGMDNLSTMTTLYLSISTELSRKDSVRIGRCDEPQMLEDIEVMQSVEAEHRYLEVFAFQGLVNNIIEFNPRHQSFIDSHARQSGITLPPAYKSTLQQLSFLRTSDVQQHQGKKNYHFLHLTFQEFFAASHFVRHWLSNDDLIRLDLDSAVNGHGDIISPSKFLQIEKYNPRLNIFWRFVSGLVQNRSGHRRTGMNNPTRKCTNVLTFFKELNDKPIDQLGAIHIRLLMYCLSELVPEKGQDFQNLQESMGKLLRQAVITENVLYNRFTLGVEAEFPEHILRSLLQDEDHLPHAVVLSALEGRSFVHTETLHTVFRFTTNAVTMDLRLQAIKVILKNLRTDSHEMVAQAVQTICSMLGDEDTDVQYKAAKALENQSHLPEEVVNALLILHRDTNKKINKYETDPILRSVESVLREQQHLLIENINILIALLKGKNQSLSLIYTATHILADHFSSLSEKAVGSLFSLLTDKNEDSDMRGIVAEELGDSIGSMSSDGVAADLSYVSEEIIGNLISLVKDKNEESFVRAHVLKMLGSQSHLPEELVSAFPALLRDESSSVRLQAIRILGNHSLHSSDESVNAALALLTDEHGLVRLQAVRILEKHSLHLSDEPVNAVLALLKDTDSYLRWKAAQALRVWPHLSEEIFDTLHTLLKDKNRIVQYIAAETLAKQPPPLPNKVIDALLALLKHEDSFTRGHVANALGSHSSHLPDNVIYDLLPLLKDESVSVRCETIRALGGQSHLSEEAVNALLPLIKDESQAVRHYVAKVLGKQSLPLPDKIIDALLVLLKDKESFVHREAIDVLGKQLSHLPEKFIDALVALLKTRNEAAYRVLQHHNRIYSMIKDLDTETWQGLWSIWLHQSVHNDISCYEFEGSLFLWSDGFKHKITDQPAQTQRLLKAVLNSPSKRKIEAVTDPDSDV